MNVMLYAYSREYSRSMHNACYGLVCIRNTLLSSIMIIVRE